MARRKAWAFWIDPQAHFIKDSDELVMVLIEILKENK
jgi:hypothetical protein